MIPQKVPAVALLAALEAVTSMAFPWLHIPYYKLFLHQNVPSSCLQGQTFAWWAVWVSSSRRESSGASSPQRIAAEAWAQIWAVDQGTPSFQYIHAGKKIHPQAAKDLATLDTQAGANRWGLAFRCSAICK